MVNRVLRPEPGERMTLVCKLQFPDEVYVTVSSVQLILQRTVNSPFVRQQQKQQTLVSQVVSHLASRACNPFNRGGKKKQTVVLCWYFSISNRPYRHIRPRRGNEMK